MKKINGKPCNIKHGRTLRILQGNFYNKLLKKNIAEIYLDKQPHFFSNFFITNLIYRGKKEGISEIDSYHLKNLHDGDIITIDLDGSISVIWSKLSNSNALFLTDFCNSKCIMCPQVTNTPKQNYYKEALKMLSFIPNIDNTNLCLTGGEPTFNKNEYLKLLSECKKKLTKCSFLILTNGKNFSDFEFLKQAVSNSPYNITYAIPLYSANSKLHDFIVDSTDSFNKTIQGIHNLYKFKQMIEIRIVISKYNFKDLLNIAIFIYWNFPFVCHVAFMGLEMCGNAAEKYDDIWIDPKDYQFELKEAVNYLNMRLINISIYNLPLCLLDSALHRYSRQSISDWKNKYLDDCNTCSKKNLCAGFFETSIKLPSTIIPFN